MISAVLFDVDDTLFDYRGAARTGILGYLTQLGEVADEAAHDRWYALEKVGYARFLAGELTFHEQRRERARGMAGRPLNDAEADAWFEGFRVLFEEAWRPFPDVLSVVTALKDHRLGVLTNSDSAYQRGKLARLGLGDAFRVVVGVDVAGAAKPSPAAFLAACAALGSEPAETAYVGDLLDGDAVAATAAGLRGIWLDRLDLGGAPGGVVRITGLAELPAALA